MTETAGTQTDYRALLRSPEYRRLLVLCGAIGVVASFAAWAFLTLVPWLQDTFFLDLPDALGFDSTPVWWPLPVLALAGLVTAVAIVYLPGTGGGIPADGLSTGVTQPSALPGVLLAALATLGLGLVLGPSSPVIALGMGVGLLVVRRVSGEMSTEALNLVAAAGAFAAFAMVFNNPIVAAIILIEAMGIGGPGATLVVLPGLLAAGIGSLVYFGMGSLTGLSTSAFVLEPLSLPALEEITIAQFGWTALVGAAAAVVVFVVLEVGRTAARLVKRRYLVLVPLAGVLVATLAILFAEITGESELAVLFSGSRALDPVVEQGPTWSVATLAWLVLFKALAWGVSMGSFRGGPVFPAIFVGTVAGLLAANLPGYPEGAAVPAAMAATVVAVLRLPLAAAVIAVSLTASAGLKSSPLVIVAIVVAYLLGEGLSALRDRRAGGEPTNARAG